MIQIGRTNLLNIVKDVPFGLYLDGGEEYGEILIPKRYVPQDWNIDTPIDVFLYYDSEDRIIATTEIPLAQVDDFAALVVKESTKFGAFLEWGLSKDLLLPYKEQLGKIETGQTVLVYVYIDHSSNRIVASQHVENFLSNHQVEYQPGEEVDVIVVSKTPLGYKCIVDKNITGLLYENEVFKQLEIGSEHTAYLKALREDGKLDLSLEPFGYKKVKSFEDTLLQFIKDNGGFTQITDKSEPEIISKTFGVSKKVYKKALGALYKQKKINITENGIKLLK